MSETEYVYLLTEYEYSTFSYDGIDAERIHIHRTYAGAVKHAQELGLEVVGYPKHPEKHASIEKMKLKD